MNLISIRFITDNIDDLINFYERVTETSAIKYTPDFAEIKTKTATLAIGSTKTLQFFGGDHIAQSGHNKSAIIEFMVEDVENDYKRLAPFIEQNVVQKPKIMPWGNKSLLFRDPDGNLVNLFSPVTPEAIEKFEN